MSAIISALLTALGPVLAYFLKKLVDRLIDGQKTEQKNADTKAKLDLFKENCLKAVRKIDLEYSNALKEQGKWGIQEQAESRRRAVEEIENMYGSQGLLDLCMFFDTNAQGLKKLIETTIEAALFDTRKQPGQLVGSIKLENS